MYESFRRTILTRSRRVPQSVLFEKKYIFLLRGRAVKSRDPRWHDPRTRFRLTTTPSRLNFKTVYFISDIIQKPVCLKVIYSHRHVHDSCARARLVFTEKLCEQVNSTGAIVAVR